MRVVVGSVIFLDLRPVGPTPRAEELACEVLKVESVREEVHVAFHIPDHAEKSTCELGTSPRHVIWISEGVSVPIELRERPIAERKERPQEHRPELGSGRCGETAFEEARNQQFAIDRAQAWLCP